MSTERLPRGSGLAGRLCHYTVTDGGCWLYRGPVSSNGYVRTAQQWLHRAAYEAAHGPIPTGMTVDHTCHNKDLGCAGGPTCLHRRCINPAHLEVVTRVENYKRALGHDRSTLRKTHCKHGHEFTPANTLQRKNGRECRACARKHRAEYRARKAAA